MENCLVNPSGIDQYYKENAEMSDFILQQQFYKYFSKDVPHEKKVGRALELIISPKCNLGCKYCYVHRYRDKLFDDDCFNEEKTISNLKLLCEWMRHNNFNMNIEIFSGELLAQEVGYRVLNTLADYYASVGPDMRCENISIPTNFTFICSDEAIARVEAIRKRFKDLDIELALSASFDGKYMEQNRPYLHDLDVPLGGVRDDAYYDKAFEYIFKTCGGFHPMMYSKGIELWPKNFDWFQEMFEKHDIPWNAIYLLQVRNVEWTQQQVKDMRKFIRHLYQFAFDKLDHDPEVLADWIIHDGFNTLSTPYTSVGRGLSCGIQSQFAVRVSDLMMYPCHRTGYKEFYYGRFVPDDKEVLRYENINTEMLLMTYSISKESLPFCAQCPINKLCGGVCLGAQYEANNNFLVPIPSVCALHYGMIIENMLCAKDFGAWGILYRMMDDRKRQQFKYLERAIQ